MDLITQSGARKFLGCRKAYEFRYERNLVTKVEPHELAFGTIWHDALQAHHLGQDAMAVIREKCKSHQTNDDMYNLVAMMRGYVERHGHVDDEPFEVVALEQEFSVPLIDPRSGKQIGEWKRGGKVDGIIRMRRSGKLWLMEHKTAARIDAAYLGKLWLDFQITSYSGVAAEVYGEPLEGVLYNVTRKLPKAQRARKLPETDGEWDVRYEAAKNKKLLKRKLGETDGEYAERLCHSYRDGEMFHREEILLDALSIDKVQLETAMIVEDINQARRDGTWYRNTDNCFKFYKGCEYLPLCRSHENPLLIDAHYTTKAAHSELSQPTESEDGDE